MKKLQMRWIAALLALMMLLPLSGCGGEKVQDPKTLLEGKTIMKEIAVPGKLVNFVAK